MEIFYGPISMLLLQCAIISLLILTLFRLRLIFGLGLLWITLGVFQFLQVFLTTSLFVEVAPGITVSSGSMVFFTGSLFAIILIYISEGIIEARKTIYAILVANIVLILLLILRWWTFDGKGAPNIYQVPLDYYVQNAHFLIIGTLVLVLDFFTVIFIYELLSKYIKILFFRILIVMTIVLSIDSFLISIGLFGGDENFQNVLVSSTIFKILAVIVYTSFFTIYLLFIDPKYTRIEKSSLSFLNIFKSLTFFKRYEDIIVELQSEKDLTYKLEKTINNISDGFVSLDTNWCYTYLNKAAGELLGRSPDSLIGKHIWTEFPEGVGLPFYNAYYKAAETQQTQYLQQYYEPFDRWFENRIYPSSEGITIYFTDITEIKKAQETLKLATTFNKELVHSLRSGLVVMNIDGEIIDVNPSFCHITQFAKEELMGAKAPFPFWPPESYQEIQTCLQKTLQGEIGNFEFLFMRKGGERFPAVYFPEIG